ncbi:hypothetical protein HYFRA_00006911 [Hymenoscyphus fraxineus]|uniref:Uncharacterized protein n=1 Tax=Hymenoscyphus fraxineus TaxID=746836 RepID=A0A9N9KQX8_9HELO|nr:hypothetical protein HYFRA_00006911 [Hymenoscyphus fraxineus]
MQGNRIDTYPANRKMRNDWGYEMRISRVDFGVLALFGSTFARTQTRTQKSENGTMGGFIGIGVAFGDSGKA